MQPGAGGEKQYNNTNNNCEDERAVMEKLQMATERESVVRRREGGRYSSNGRGITKETDKNSDTTAKENSVFFSIEGKGKNKI